MKILVVKLSSFGDVIAALPAVTDAVAAGVEVDWLADSAFAHVARLHPGVRTVHALGGREARSLLKLPGYFAESAALKRQLRAESYDRVADLQGLMKSALPARWAKAPVHGYADPREAVAARLYDVRHAVSWELHAVERNRALMAAALDRPAPTAPGRFGLAPAAPVDGEAPYGVILHSASWPSKLWPEDRWRALLDRHRGVRWRIPWGSTDERARSERLAEGFAHVEVLPGRLTSAALAAFLGSARVVVGLDTGLMHLAQALGAPTVWLFGSTSPDRTGPYGEGATVIRSPHPAAPCLKRECRHEGGGCMEAIAVDAVDAALGARQLA